MASMATEDSDASAEVAAITAPVTPQQVKTRLSAPSSADSAKKLLASHTKRRMAGLNLGEYSSPLITAQAMLTQYRDIQSCLPQGMYIIPDEEDLMRWHGFLHIRSSVIYEANVLTFIIDTPPTFPADGAMPTVHLGTRPPHPLVKRDVSNLSPGKQSQRFQRFLVCDELAASTW